MIAEPINTETEPKSEANDTPGIFSTRRRVKAHIEELEKSVADLKAEVESERDKRLRLLAEYDNYRRRTQSEYGQIIKSAGERIILKLLPALDDFGRFFAHHPIPVERASRPLEQESANETGGTPVLPILQAVELIQRKMIAILESEGLAPIDSVGQPFDAELHDAVAQVPHPEAVEGTVVAEAEKGYRLGDKIIRHAKVVISKAPESSEGDA